MKIKLRSVALLPAVTLLLAACQGGSGSSSASASAGGTASGGTAGTPCDSAPEGDALATICERGTIRVATDPAYPPQSELLPDGSYEGFDIDVANEIADRLGVTVEFVTPDFAEVVAGGWADRFDISVGSVTITTEREEVLDFTEPYYFTPAQMAVTEESGITSLDELSGETVCVGESTTYQLWLEGTLSLAGGAPEPATPPDGVEVTTFSTDTECADSVESGRTDFAGWLSSSTTVATALADGLPMVEVGEPVFYEPLAVATDKEADEHAALMEALDSIIAEMHEDGTLTEFSETWFDGLDLTTSE